MKNVKAILRERESEQCIFADEFPFFKIPHSVESNSLRSFTQPKYDVQRKEDPLRPGLSGPNHERRISRGRKEKCSRGNLGEGSLIASNRIHTQFS